MDAFFDLHIHLLYGVDDGAQSFGEMTAMLDAVYADGTRAICATPHFSHVFPSNTQRSAEVFEELLSYAEKKYPDLYLYLGHELGYYSGAIDDLNGGRCRSINESKYVLVDFPESVAFYELQNGMLSLLRTGYTPILAHTERYRALVKNFSWLEEFVSCGGVIQLNASSACGAWGSAVKQQWRRLVRAGLVQLISSDGHNLKDRPPQMSVCMEQLRKYGSPETVQRLLWDNACRVVGDESIEY